MHFWYKFLQVTDKDQVAEENEEDEDSAEDETKVGKIQTTFFSVKMKVEGPSPWIIISLFLVSDVISINPGEKTLPNSKPPSLQASKRQFRLFVK